MRPILPGEQINKPIKRYYKKENIPGTKTQNPHEVFANIILQPINC